MSNINTAIAALKEAFGDQISTSASVLNTHGESQTYYPITPPDAVAYPRSTAEVQKMVRICADHGCPIIPWGVGTSLEGHALAFNGGVTLNMQEMNKVVEVYPQDLCVRVQPGITREEVNTELRATGLFFPIDPGANATIGGMTATQASGTTAVRYGTMKDNVMALEVVLADGRVIRTGTRAKKSSAGYDLTRLFVGSEGTLGIITEVTLKLQGQPEAISSAICSFPDTDGAVNSVITAIQMGLPIARCEYVDVWSIRAINAYADLNMEDKPHLFMEFHGSDASVKEQAEMMQEITTDLGGEGFQWSTKAEERNKLWQARHDAYWACKAQNPTARGISTDVCVPISELAGSINATMADIEASPLEGSIIGHVGDGNYHVLFLVSTEDDSEFDIAMDLTHRMNSRAIEVGGTVTGEHGIGRGKKKYMTAEHGDGWAIMGDIKRTLDPQNILNPGKVVEVN